MPLWFREKIQKVLRKVSALKNYQERKPVRKAIVLSGISGFLLAIPFINGGLWIFAWVGLIPLIFAVTGKTKLQAFLLGCFCGFVFWWLTIYWLVHVTFLGTAVLIVYLSLYFGFFAVFIALSSALTLNHRLLFLSAAWVILEYLRAHLLTGFPWALMGYSQYLNLSVIQIADLTGVWGVSCVAVFVNLAIAAVINSRLQVSKAKTPILIAAGLLFFAYAYGFYVCYLPPIAYQSTPVRISLIQANIPQELKWDPSAKSYIFNQYLLLTYQAKKDTPGLILWPEASLPGVIGDDPQLLLWASSLQKEVGIPFLLGAVERKDDIFYNRALFFNRKGEVTHYDKLHLVPFGEYIPLKKTFPFLETIVPIGDITPGQEYTLFAFNNSHYPDAPVFFSTLICFEDVFPELSRFFVQRGAKFLVNITNDGWYKLTPAPYQHLSASVFRAVENRVWLARCANTGISCFIAPTGKISAYVEDARRNKIFFQGLATGDIYPRKGLAKSFYTRFGDWFVLVSLLVVLYGCMCLFVARGKKD